MEAQYKLDFSQKEQKYLHVELKLNLKNYKQRELVLMMPVWSPGSYLIREYSRYLDSLKIVDSKTNKPIKFEKTQKNQWAINLDSSDEIKVSYRLYCNEFSVRTNFIDDVHALIVSPATFLIPLEKDLCKRFEVEVDLPKDWNKISTGLDKVEGYTNRFYSNNLDDFLDCPIEVGNYDTYEFEAFGKPHYVAMIGPKNYDEKKLISDMKLVVEETAKLIGEVPYEHYTFVTHLTSSGGGGLEHKNSCILNFSRWDFINPDKYKKAYLSLVSHEYFHLWNVKRIKPVELSNFDYNNENYTSLLWMCEGFTSYFDDLILRQAKIYDDAEFLSTLANIFKNLLLVEGRFYQNLEESSFDTWIKFYRRHENSSNQHISYYVKGAIFALCLDLEIRKRTNSKKNLAHVMRMLWEDYKKDESTGFTKEIIISYTQKLVGEDLSELFDEFLTQTNEPDYNKFLSYAGLKLNIVNLGNPTFDIETKEENGNIICSKIIDKGSAYNSGLMFGDEIISINNYRVNSKNILSVMKNLSLGSSAKLLINRDERILEKEIIVSGSKYDDFRVEKIQNPSSEQLELQTIWFDNK